MFELCVSVCLFATLFRIIVTRNQRSSMIFETKYCLISFLDTLVMECGTRVDSMNRPHLVHVKRIRCFDSITDAGIQCIGGVFATSTIDSRMGIHRCEPDNKYIPKHKCICLPVEQN